MRPYDDPELAMEQWPFYGYNSLRLFNFLPQKNHQRDFSSAPRRHSALVVATTKKEGGNRAGDRYAMVKN